MVLWKEQLFEAQDDLGSIPASSECFSTPGRNVVRRNMEPKMINGYFLALRYRQVLYWQNLQLIIYRYLAIVISQDVPFWDRPHAVQLHFE